jgi:2'-5' RNA ligase
MLPGFSGYNDGSMELLRLFVALTIPDDVTRHLSAIESLLQSGTTAPVKWVSPDEIHLTLKFLGDTESDKVTDIIHVLHETTAGIPRLNLVLNRLGVFPSIRNTQVAWAGLEGDLEELNRLQQVIENGLEGLGIRRENRRFSPHLTLGRVRERATPGERDGFGKLVTGTVMKPKAFIADAVHLIRSRLTGQGPVYTPLNTFQLE